MKRIKREIKQELLIVDDDFKDIGELIIRKDEDGNVFYDLNLVNHIFNMIFF